MFFILDGLVKSHFILFVILAQAGIHSSLILLDSRLRGNDGVVEIQVFCEAIILQGGKNKKSPPEEYMPAGGIPCLEHKDKT